MIELPAVLFLIAVCVPWILYYRSGKKIERLVQSTVSLGKSNYNLVRLLLVIRGHLQMSDLENSATWLVSEIDKQLKIEDSRYLYELKDKTKQEEKYEEKTKKRY